MRRPASAPAALAAAAVAVAVAAALLAAPALALAREADAPLQPTAAPSKNESAGGNATLPSNAPVVTEAVMNSDLDAGSTKDPEVKKVVENPTPKDLDNQGNELTRFDYEYGGDDWEGLCKTGKLQSPINLNNSAVDKKLLHSAEAGRHFIMSLHYKPAENVSLDFNGKSIWIRGDFGYLMNGCCEQVRYNALQVVFHARSEHTVDASPVNDGHFAMEMHIVHQKEGSSGKDDLLITAVLFELYPPAVPLGAPAANATANPFLTELGWADLATLRTKPATPRKIDIYSTISKTLEGAFYAYKGSLTTPTCDETVMWRVMARVEHISAPELQLITDLLRMDRELSRGNNRKPQPRNGREITYVY